MEPEVQMHILNNLKELNTTVAQIGQGQRDICDRLDKIGPWVKSELDKTNDNVAGLQRWQAVSSWKLGTLSAGAGAVLSFCAQWIAVHFFGTKLR